MKHLRQILLIMVTFGILASGFVARAEDKHHPKEGPFVVVEGTVSHVSARILIVNDQQYPISKFARVFDVNGQELSVQMIANIGKIDKAKIFILGGKIEKIIVLKNN